MPGSTQVTYGYDAVGNRLSEAQSGVTVTHGYASTSNRQTTQAGLSIGYDANGNRTSDGGGARSYSYNSRNRLAGISEGAASVASYEYNALGQRVRKVTASEDTDFVYDLDGKLLGEYADGVLRREYVYLNGRPVAQIDASQEVLYLHYDHLGTPRSATDANRHVVWRWDSDPFGASEPDSDPDGDSTHHVVLLRFPGQYDDEESGRYYNQLRDYDADVGRFVQSDLVGLLGGVNRYLYAGAQPTSRVDPLGLAWGEARAAAHFYFGGGETVSLSQTGHYGAVTRRIQPVRNQWKKSVASRARAEAYGIACSSTKRIRFQDRASAQSGVFWIGGFSISRKADCFVSVTCRPGQQCPPMTWKRYRLYCGLTLGMHDEFVDPSDFDNSGGTDFWDHWQYGGEPFFVDATWRDNISREGPL